MFLALTIALAFSSQVEEFNQNFIKKSITAQNNYAVVLGFSGQVSKQIQDIFKQAASKNTNQSYHFAIVDKRNKFTPNAIGMIGCCKQNPNVAILAGKSTKYLNTQDISQQGIITMIKLHGEGLLKQHFKSELDQTQPNGTYVRKLIGSNFRKEVIQSEKQFLVMVFAPWCKACKAIKQEYEEAAFRLKGNQNVVIARVDGSLNDIPQIKSKGFPTIVWFRKGVESKAQGPVDFVGDRTAEEIISFIKENTGFSWVEPAQPLDQQSSSSSQSRDL